MHSLHEIETARLKSYLEAMHKRITSFTSYEEMSYPFLTIDPSIEIATVIDWAHGLWRAMGLTPGYWTVDNSDEISGEGAEFYVCRQIVHDVANPLTVIESCDESEDAGVENLLKEILLLGDAVYYLGERCKSRQ